MKTFALIILSGSLILLASACAPKEEMPRIIPMEDFFKNPEKTAFALSPDGDYLAFFQPWESRMNIHIQKIGEDDRAGHQWFLLGQQYAHHLRPGQRG